MKGLRGAADDQLTPDEKPASMGAPAREIVRAVNSQVSVCAGALLSGSQSTNEGRCRATAPATKFTPPPNDIMREAETLRDWVAAFHKLHEKRN